MHDEKQFSLAMARLEALRNNVPGVIRQKQVDEFHSILDALESASGEELRVFRVPASEMSRRVIGGRFATRRSPGRIDYSSEERCDESFFTRQIEGVWKYLRSLGVKGRMEHNMKQQPDYWSMDDSDLEALAHKYSVPPFSRAGAQGGNFYLDRDRIIDTLLKRDNALRKGEALPYPSSVINIEGSVHGSSIQQGTDHTSATIDFHSKETELRGLVSKIRDSMNQLEVSAGARKQLEADVQTVEAQLLTSHPKPIIVIESLKSLRTIMEGIAGNVIASGILFEITKYLGNG